MKLLPRFLVSFVVSLALSLFALEIFVQTAQIEGPSSSDFDTIIGRKRRGNMFFTRFNEGFSMGVYNKDAYLGPAYSPEKPSGTIRLAVLGDSYVESFQLFRRDQFHSILEKELSKVLDMNVEVLNFGRSGFDLADMYAYQQRLVYRFQPDYFLYFLSEADLLCIQTDPLIPKVVEKPDSLIVTNELMPIGYLNIFNRTKIFTQNSSLLNMVNNCRKLVLAGKFWPKMLDKFYWSSKSPQGVHIRTTDEVPELALKIVDNLPENVIIVNKGFADFPQSFRSAVKEKDLMMIDLHDTLSILEKNGINPNFWSVTNTSGHWNYEAHQAIGYFLSNKIEIHIRSKKKKE